MGVKCTFGLIRGNDHASTVRQVPNRMFGLKSLAGLL